MKTYKIEGRLNDTASAGMAKRFLRDEETEMKKTKDNMLSKHLGGAKKSRKRWEKETVDYLLGCHGNRVIGYAEARNKAAITHLDSTDIDGLHRIIVNELNFKKCYWNTYAISLFLSAHAFNRIILRDNKKEFNTETPATIMNRVYRLWMKGYFIEGEYAVSIRDVGLVYVRATDDGVVVVTFLSTSDLKGEKLALYNQLPDKALAVIANRPDTAIYEIKN